MSKTSKKVTGNTNVNSTGEGKKACITGHKKSAPTEDEV